MSDTIGGLVGGSLEDADTFIRGLLSVESFDRQALEGLHVSADLHLSRFSIFFRTRSDYRVRLHVTAVEPKPPPSLRARLVLHLPLPLSRTQSQDFRFEPGRCVCRFPVLPHVQNR